MFFPTKFRPISLLVVFIAFSCASSMYAQGSWPTSWVNYTLTGGGAIQDPQTDSNPGHTNLWFSTADPSTVKIAFDGTYCYFRIQLETDPPDANSGGFRGAGWVIQIADQNGNYLVSACVDGQTGGGQGAADILYIGDQISNTKTTVATWAPGSPWMRGLQVPGSTTWYMDFQVPLASFNTFLIGLGKSTISGTTPLKFYYGSRMNDPTAGKINKDYMLGNVSTVDFTTCAIAYLSSIQGGTLPVELVSFQAYRILSAVRLAWRTATEKNNLGFEVERKSGDAAWERIGFVEGRGTSNSPVVYSFTDNPPKISGSSLQYRLKQLDRDGIFTYSQALTVQESSASAAPVACSYPNPVSLGGTGGAVIRYDLRQDAHVLIRLYNTAGSLIATLVDEERPAGSHSIHFPGPELQGSLRAGVYYYTLSTERTLLAQAITVVQ